MNQAFSQDSVSDSPLTKYGVEGWGGPIPLGGLWSNLKRFWCVFHSCQLINVIYGRTWVIMRCLLCQKLKIDWSCRTKRICCINTHMIVFHSNVCPNLILVAILGEMLCINQFQRCPSPPGNRGAFAHVVSPGGWALAYPGATPGHLTPVFSKDGRVCKDTDFVKDWLVRQGLEKLVDVFKDMFSHFHIFLHYL